MPAIGNVTINDGQATPLSHTFTAITPQSGTTPSLWADLSVAVEEQRPTLSAVVRKASGNSKRSKAIQTIAVPLVRTDTSGIASVVDYMSFRIEGTIPSIATDVEKKNALAYAKNFFSTTIISQAVIDGQLQF